MKRLLIVLVLVLAACAEHPGDRVVQSGFGDIRRWEDPDKGVICWVYKDAYAGGISCLSESDVVDR